ncbi:ArsR/SmtB family transcription factor [Mycetocola reblochoni]|uniref:ArsR family transcriptional regulator n=2 Tax=Mycetocola reblochoni TaxID=331618 RepID=A0A3L6ZP13_9MICO|nr:DUF5937 family protein [Mycetocola reblochoni]RLP69558.1 ArsR family transcriptional regulator [Mycetocola reblochoni]SJN27170.1 putative transcriptional regulator [Mycetocola reblochoni REB411]
MLRYQFDAAALSAVRFGISPLNEMGLGLRAFRAPERYPLQHGWLQRIADVRHLLDEEMLAALVDDRRWVADFVTPRPTAPVGDIDDELDTLASLTPEQLERDLRVVHGRIPPPFVGRHADVMDRLLTALRRAWRLCFEPHWSRMRAVLEADIAHRGRVMAREGMMSMVGGLTPAVHWAGHSLDVTLSAPFGRDRPVGVDGLTLAPSVFVINASTMIDLDRSPTLIYPARGQGAMWAPLDRSAPGATDALLGPTRAGLLSSLAEPRSSTELAFSLGVSPSAVNQHLRVMHAAGLLNRTRHGRSVLYYRSALGDALLAGRGTRI